MNFLFFNSAALGILLVALVNVSKCNNPISSSSSLSSHRLSSLPQDFRPSQLLSETGVVAGNLLSSSSSSNQINTNIQDYHSQPIQTKTHQHQTVTTRSVSIPIQKSDDPKLVESSLAQGRIFGGHQHQNGFGGGSGWSSGGSSWTGGGHQCQHLTSYNPGCCNLGYTNCCGGHGGIGGGGAIHFPRPPGNSWGSVGSGPIKGPFIQPGYHHHHPRPPKPVLLPVRPVIHHPHQHPHYHIGGGGGYEKPGSCYYRSPFSFISKLNIFNKDKGHQNTKGGSGGWGWNAYPPSNSGGWYFHRRSDRFVRQLDLTPNTNRGYDDDLDNYSRDDGYFPQNYQGLRSNYQQVNKVINDKKYEESYHSPSYDSRSVPYNVGIGSLTGRVFGGLGWNSGITTGWTAVNPNAPCYTDYECPGNQKCCGSVCKTPSFSG